jgi:hypothetical protein
LENKVALRKFLWVQVELPEVKKDRAAEARATLESACFGFQLLNAAIEAFGVPQNLGGELLEGSTSNGALFPGSAF